MEKTNIIPWKHIRSEQGPDLILFKARFDWLENPRNAKSKKVIVLEASDWVNVVAVTPENKVLVVRQYRFGTGGVTTEIPAGIVEAGETSEHAAARELKEETGYTAAAWKYLGWVEPNPACQNNHCHQWLALDVVKTAAPALDDGEDLSCHALSLDALRREIKEGRLRHTLALSALAQVFDLRDDAERQRFS